MMNIHFISVFRKTGMLAGLLVLPFVVWAQPNDPHAGHGVQEDPHAGHGAQGAEESSTTTEHDPAAMEHGQMRAQGGSAPEDARDPHAYSGGYTLTEGPYAHPGPRLRLMDEHTFWGVLGNRLEYDVENDTGLYDLQAWYGTTYNRATIKLEGEISDSRLEESQTEFLWSRSISAFFDTQLGARFDQYDEGTNRNWLGFGIQGLAPYWFELDVTAYLGESGRSALSLEAEYELFFTQRLILQPRAEVTFYGKDDVDNRLGSGLSSAELGLRLRYELSRQFAPYVGIEWTGRFGDTADLRRASGESARDTVYVAGIKFWF